MTKKRYSMKWKVIRILLLCWLIPFLFMIAVLGVYIGTNHSDTIALNFKEQMDFNVRSCIERLDKAINDSRQASYDETILKTRKELDEHNLSYDSAHKEYLSYMTRMYQNNRAISDAILWFDEGMESRSAFVYNTKNNGSYQQIRSYWDQDHRAIRDYARTLGTRIGFQVKDQKLYMIRNLMDNHYEAKAVLVFLLNPEYCFESVFTFPAQEFTRVRINEETELYSGSREEAIEPNDKGFYWNHGQLYLTEEIKTDSYSLFAATKIKSDINMFPFFGYQYVIGGMILSLFLMLLLVLWVFKREVTEPLKKLTEGVGKIDNGELGYQIDHLAMNEEFSYLTETVNRMSNHLENQFMKIYQEEIALREARIMALQSHINPHFMNNTLEIINWEARLGGNVKVSNMISALSRLLDAALDRRKLPEVSLKEEMSNVNAYLYIMKERLGDKLTINDQIGGELLACKVPRLILQPLIENAIEHGVALNGAGTITLKGEHKEDLLYLEIRNDGHLSEEEEEKIQRLLKPDYNTSKESSGNLGIANVNQRLRILFGEPAGLTIIEEEGEICSRIVVPWDTMF